VTLVWIDIENPPQVRYLLPCAHAFERAGCNVVITGRDYGSTVALLNSEGARFTTIGERFGKRRYQKVVGAMRRAHELDRHVLASGTPQLVLSASRPAALVAWRRRIPSFVLIDYEYVDFSIFRRSGSSLLHPRVIPAESLVTQGFDDGRLISFDGLKEDLSFAGVDIDSVAAHDFDVDPRSVRVLFRPPAEESHYHRSESREIGLGLLRQLARRESTVVVYSPRYAWQETYLSEVEWIQSPVVLREPLPSVSLLKGVDGVVSAGGTMLREAAYLGVPAYSIFRSRIGAVDQHLESIGRLRVLASAADFERIELTRANRKPVLDSNPDLVDELVEKLLARVRA
jgi:predicted glycosyltransferase